MHTGHLCPRLSQKNLVGTGAARDSEEPLVLQNIISSIWEFGVLATLCP